MFELTDEQRDIRQAAREFAEGEFTDIAAEHDETETFPAAVWKKACESGFIGAFIEEKYEGAGFGMLEYALILRNSGELIPVVAICCCLHLELNSSRIMVMKNKRRPISYR